MCGMRHRIFGRLHKFSLYDVVASDMFCFYLFVAFNEMRKNVDGGQ